MSLGFRVVSYEPARRSALLGLMREVWGSARLERELEWWFERNPAGSPLISLAEHDGRVVGVACMSPYRVRLDGEEVIAPVPLHVATHPAWRGRGVFSALEEENERRAAERWPVALTFPNRASARVFAGKLGWSELPGARVWARTVVERRLPAGVEVVREVGPEADERWRALAPAYGNGLFRDRAYLEWRFAAAPRRYTLLASRDGLAVAGQRTVRGREVAYLAELVAPPGAEARRLARAALAATCARLFLALPLHGRGGELARLGFLPTPKRIAFMAKALRPEARIPGSWTLSLGDGDSW